MTRVHLKVEGGWAVCRATYRACPRVLHLPDTSLAAARALPEWFVEQLAEAVDPPQVHAFGVREWVDVTGTLHRLSGLPARITDDGSREYFMYGERHRVDGPAVVYADSLWVNKDPRVVVTEEWWLRGRRHRTDGPAIVRPFGQDEFWVNGLRVS